MTQRIIKISGKCSDLAYMTIDHLGIEHDGYMPHLGLLGGDYINLSIDMDTGLIIGWEPITDEMVKADDTLFPDGHPDEDEETEVHHSAEAEVASFTMAHVHVQRFNGILVGAFGADWMSNPEAREILQQELTKYTHGHEHDALIKLLGRCTA